MATSSGGVLRIELGVPDLAETRFAASPLLETVAALRVLADPRRHHVHLPWVRWAHDALADHPLRLPLVWSLFIERYRLPEFLLPAPSAGTIELDDELRRLERTPVRDIRTGISRYTRNDATFPALAELATNPELAIRAITAELRAAHELLVAPHWHRMHAVLDADVTYRARNLADLGAAQMLTDLHPRLSWHGDHVDIHDPSRPTGITTTVALGPGGLVLVPSVFLWPDLWTKPHTITRTTIRYPARGITSLWDTTLPGRPSTTTTCERLIGRPRTRILALLTSPATTTDLATALNVTPSAISQHLTILRDTGLIHTRRHKRTAIHTITTTGRTLLESARTMPKQDHTTWRGRRA